MTIGFVLSVVLKLYEPAERAVQAHAEESVNAPAPTVTYHQVKAVP